MSTTPYELHRSARLRAAWEGRNTPPTYSPSVQDDALEPWSLCLLDEQPKPIVGTPPQKRIIDTRASRRALNQKLRQGRGRRWGWLR